MKNIIVFIVMIGTLISCSNDQKQFQIIKVSDNVVSDSNTISNLKFIPLQITPNSIIASIGEVQYYKDEYYVLDPQYSNLMVFDSHGKYLRSIGGIGRGPGEFTRIRDFNIYPDKNEIKVISNNEQKVFTYDLEGNFLYDEELKVFGNLFIDFDGERYVYIDHNDNDLSGQNNIIVYHENEIVDRLFPFSNQMNLMLANEGFLLKSVEDNIIFNPGLSDTIYTINKEIKYAPKYMFDFGEYALPKEARKSSEVYMSISNNYKYLARKFYENKNFIAFGFYENGMESTGLAILKESGAISSGVDPTESYKLNFPCNPPVGGFNNTVISCIYEYELKKEANQNKIKKLISDHPQLDGIIGTTKDGNNPVLITYDIHS